MTRNRLPLSAQIRRYLTQLIEDSPLSQAAIAERLGKSQTWVSQYHTGTRGQRVQVDELDALSRVFDRTLRDVLNELDAGVKAPKTDREDRWLALFRSLSPNEQDVFEATLTALVRAKAQALRNAR